MAIAFHVLSGIVSRTGAALRLCTLTNARMLFVTLFAHKHKHSKATRELRTRKRICAILLPACFPSFSLFLSFCLSPAVTRSNPQSNDRRSLTLIKGGQLTRGPGVTFIRRLVKVYFSLALNTGGRQAGRVLGTWTSGGCSCRRRRGGGLKPARGRQKNLWRVVCFVWYLFC